MLITSEFNPYKHYYVKDSKESTLATNASIDQNKTTAQTQNINLYSTGVDGLRAPAAMSLSQTKETEFRNGKEVINNTPYTAIVAYDLYDKDGNIIERAGMIENQSYGYHGFMVAETDFLYEATSLYATLGENQVFRNRAINDNEFITNTLQFFKNESFSQEDYDLMSKQMESVVTELSEKVRNGETLNRETINSVESKLTIDGVDFTIGQLLDMQEIAKAMRGSMSDMGTRNEDSFAKAGLAQSIAKFYGSTQGAAGEKFAQVITQRSETYINKLQTYLEDSYVARGSVDAPEHVKIMQHSARQIADMFTDLDTTSKDAMRADLQKQLDALTQWKKEYLTQIGLSANAADNKQNSSINDLFEAWMKRI